MFNQHHNRNGITLLFVVSMIVLFLLMGTTFVIVSSDYLRSAKKRARVDLHSVDGTAFIERAFYDLVRGPSLSDSTSPLRGHSLLADMYGYGFTANIASASPNDSQHFITLTLDFAGSGRSILDQSAFEPAPVPAMAGLVLSVVTGPATGLTARIVDHQVSGDSSSGYTHTFVVLPEWIDNSFNVANAAVLAGAQVVVNGRPFSGTGAGNFNPYVGLDQAALSDWALRPNQTGRSLAQIVGQSGSGYFSRGNSLMGYYPNPVGPNECYDTFDFQNMFLAGINPDGSVHKPSFHRSELIGGSPQPARANFRAFVRGGPNNDGVMVDNDNNGQVDGIWMDIGLPSLSNARGIQFKPLVSYTVVDLDGRINVNAHGNLRQSDAQMVELDLLGYPMSQGLHRGQGYGPPEISLLPVLSGDYLKMMFGDGEFPGRYGFDNLPGEANVRDDWSSYKLFGYPDESASAPIPGTVDRHFGTAMDMHGRFAIGYPHDIRDINDPEFPIGLPVANLSTSSLTSEVVDSAYEMSFADGTQSGPGNRGFDQPFTPQELEGVLRRNDLDSNMLASVVFGSWGIPERFTSGGAQNSITTDSFEVPTIVENLPFNLFMLLSTTGDPLVGIPSSVTDREQVIRDTVEYLLPREVFRGLPMNVNRAFGDGIDNNGNGVIDEMGEAGFLTHPSGDVLDFDEDNDAIGSGDSNAFLARAHYARQLYVITLLTTERVDRNGDGRINNSDWYDFNDDGNVDQDDRLDYRRLIAQWAINVVDFRDRDSIMTPFEVDLNPWNGWEVDDDISSEETSLGAERHVFWGAERPELLISETFASHDRRTQDLEIDPTLKSTTDEDEPDNDFDSHLVPNVSVFFELYNPWVMNDVNQARPPELYDDGLNGVELQKTSLDGTSPVWRLNITATDEADLDPDDATHNDEASGKTATSVRRIYFAEPSFVIDSGPEVYFPDPDLDVGFVGPGLYAVVGSGGVKEGDDYVTYFGRRFTPDAINELDQTRRIVLDPENREFEIAYWDFDKNEMTSETRRVVTLPIDRHQGGRLRNLGVSDPIAGYNDLNDAGIDIEMTPVEDGHKFTADVPEPETNYAFDEPVDRKLDSDHYDDYLANDGLRPGYRTVHLQRLANPMLPFDALTNPYRTVDSSAIDLLVYNGVDLGNDPLNVPEPIRCGTFERRSAKESEGQPAANGQLVSDNRHRLLFKNDRKGHQFIDEEDSPDISGADFHIFSRNLKETFGAINSAWREANPEDQQPFAALTWNNRPFVSHLELANVPFTSSYWLTRLFNSAADDSRDVYAPDIEEEESTEARNYTAHFPYLLNFYADELKGGSQYASSLHRIFDFLEVPSRFVGTESYVNPLTFSGDRHGLSFGMAAPFDTISNYRYPGKLNINTVLDPRVWNGLMQFYALDPETPLTYDDWNASRAGSSSAPTDFANPYRSPLACNRVPVGTGMVVTPADCGLFRNGTKGPLFDYDPPNKQAYNNDDRAAYFKYDRRQRLGNLVTSRSSVFAIWITIGYFEMNSDGSLKTKFDGTGYEIGAEDGGARRNRAFFIFDRSIPVAFEPGKNHNVDRAVLVRSMIE